MKKTVCISALALVAACSSPDPVYNFNHREAGSFIDEGGFGNPTMHNTLVMTGQRHYAIDLGQRFASEVPTTITFAFNSARLDGASRQVLRQQAQFIKQFPEVRFRVFGHTDLVGDETYNKGLGLQRARAVVHFLASQGISKSRLEAVVSQGETQPLIYTPNQERKNRRAVTEVTGFVKNHPLVMQGKYAEIVVRGYYGSASPQENGSVAAASAAAQNGG